MVIAVEITAGRGGRRTRSLSTRPRLEQMIARTRAARLAAGHYGALSLVALARISSVFVR